jgi:hypothetical protein
MKLTRKELEACVTWAKTYSDGALDVTLQPDWLIARLQELLRSQEVLRKVEWVGSEDHDYASCPCCYRWEHESHAPDCALKAAMLEDE